MKKDKLFKNIKLYNVIMNNFWLLITTTLTGVVIGYFWSNNSKKEDNHYMLFSIIIFFVIGVINFFIRIIKELNKVNQVENELEEEKENV